MSGDLVDTYRSDGYVVVPGVLDAGELAALRTESFFAARVTRADLSAARAVLQRAGVGKPAMKGDRLPRAKAK